MDKPENEDRWLDDDDEYTLMVYPSLDCVGCKYSYRDYEWFGGFVRYDETYSCKLQEPQIDKKTYHCKSYEKETNCKIWSY